MSMCESSYFLGGFACLFVVTNGMVRMMIIWDRTIVVVEWFDEVFMQFYA